VPTDVIASEVILTRSEIAMEVSRYEAGRAVPLAVTDNPRPSNLGDGAAIGAATGATLVIWTHHTSIGEQRQRPTFTGMNRVRDKEVFGLTSNAGISACAQQRAWV
jgi:hypothetical protein